MTNPGGGRSDSDAAVATALGATLAPLLMLVCGGHFTASDDAQKYLALKAMLQGGTVFFPEGWVSGLGGGCSFYPLGGSLVMLPGALLGWLLEPLVPVRGPDIAARFFISFQNAWITAALVAVLFLFGRLVGCARGPSLVAALGLGFGTMVLPYARTCWSEPATALAVILAMVLLLQASSSPRTSRAAWAGVGVAFALAALIRLEVLILAPGAMAWLVWRHRGEPALVGRALTWMAPPVALALGLALAYNAARFGSPWHFSNWHTVQDAIQMPYGGRPAWALANLWHYTFNPGDGPCWYSPALWLGIAGWPALWRARPDVGRLVAWTAGPLFIFYVAAWGLSDWAWGLRYAYVFHPLVMLGACALVWRPGWQRLALGGVLAAGVVVQVVALPHNFGYLFERERAAHPGLTIQALMADPRHAPLWLAVRDWPGTVLGGFELVAAPRPLETPEVHLMRLRSQFVPDFWPFLALLTSVSRLHIVLALVFLASFGLLGLLRLRHTLRGAMLEGAGAQASAGRDAA
ncbi:MAG: hypothetical protein VKS61_18900 [Candidatus Sericytochromatia bacterium]|nr:hypothetical protein [Candidatus Sericytochromatia bacterium]